MAQESERQLRQSVVEAAARELSDAQTQPKPVVTTRTEGVSSLNLRDDIRRELEQMAGPTSYQAAPEFGPDLLGMPARTVTVNLERAVQSALDHNNAVQFARLSPAIQEQQLLAAEAAFDWTLFSTLTWDNSDTPRVSIGGQPRVDQNQSLSSTLGIRRTLMSGGRFTMQQDLSYTDQATPGQTYNPNPANDLGWTFQWDQPLLKNAGSDVSQAQIRVTRNAERNAIQTLKRDLIKTANDAEHTYWELVRAYGDLRIKQRLYERGRKTRDQVQQRAIIDANNAQIADATARVERRRAEVLRAQANLQLLSNQLKGLMNDPSIPVGSEVILVPADQPADEPVQFSLLECLRTAVQHRPEVVNSMLAIDDASIRQIVADNQRLPELSLRLQTKFAAIDNEPLKAYGDLGENFIDYLAGLNFEMPIGNRAGEAGYRQRRLERMQSVIAYRNTVQQVVGDTKNALYRIAFNYPLIEQTRASRYAAANVLRVADIEKEQGLGFTPERLNIELNNQESLSAAEQSEVEALTDYNTAIADLFAAMGTTLERNNVEFVVPAD
ncbi:MAG: TolC family protein [Phycisphaerales bacterium]